MGPIPGLGLISPGCNRKERRWAVPFVLTSAGLFIMGGVFAYFVAFRYGLTFLLSIGNGIMSSRCFDHRVFSIYL